MSKKRGKGEGSIYETSDGRWRGAVTIGYRANKNGGVTQVRKVLSGFTYAEVLDQMTKLRSDQRDGLNIMPERVTLAGHCQRWLAEVVKPHCAFKTFTTYTDMVNLHIEPALGRTLLAKLTTPQVQRFLNEKYRDGLSPKTVKHLRDTLRAALNVAVNDWGLIARNPATKAKPPAQVEPNIRVWDVPQARQFLELISSHRLEALFSLAICLGPRQGEILGLRWRNLDLGAGLLTVDGALKRIEGKLVKGKPKNEVSNRTVALPGVTIAALQRHQARQQHEREWAGDGWRETGYVFTTRIGTPIERRNLLRDWYKLLQVSGLPPIRFHDLRHSAATLLFAQGVHPRTVMEILGHSDLNTTMRIYGRVLDQMKRDAAAKMDQLFDPVATSSATRVPHQPDVETRKLLN